MREEKIITYGSLGLILLLSLAWVQWIFVMLSFLLPRLFKDGVWQSLYIVENHAVISNFAWYSYAGIWIVSIAMATWATYCGIRLMLCFARGAYFTDQSVRAIFMVGLALGATMVWDTIYDSVDHALLTWDNSGVSATLADGKISTAKPYRPVAYNYDSGDISLFLCALGFCVIGYVLMVARRYERETKEFV